MSTWVILLPTSAVVDTISHNHQQEGFWIGNLGYLLTSQGSILLLATHTGTRSCSSVCQAASDALGFRMTGCHG
jgi:hypothetical protein